MSFRPVSRVVAIVLGACLLFGWWQNTYGTTGGPISLAKMLWLFFAFTFFFVLPASQAREAVLPAPERRFWQIFLGAWLLRAAVEMPLLAFTRLWRCEHGIAHTLLMLGFLLAKGPRNLPAVLTGLTLAFEAMNAFLFSRLGSPETGQYFASSDPVFLWINRITWLEILILAPALIWWLRRPIPSPHTA